MGAVIQNGNFVGGLDAAVAAKIGTATLNTSADDLSGAINEHEEDITEIKQSLSDLDGSVSSLISGLNAASLLQYTGITSTETSYNTITVGGVQRKFSDYRYILFLLQYSESDYRDSFLLNSSFWKTGVSIPRNVLHGAGGSTGANYNVSGVVYKYNSDTSLKAVTGGQGAFQYIQVLGIGKK